MACALPKKRVLLPALIVMTVALEVLAWPVTLLLSGGFNGVSPEQFAFAVSLSRLTIPYLMLISLVSLFGGILNSLHKFWVNAAAPILLNLTLIVALLGSTAMIRWLPRASSRSRYRFRALQLAWLAWACRQNGVRLALRRPRLNPDVKKLVALIWPAAAGAGAVQINLVISTALAAKLLAHGSVTYIYMADRLNQLPLGLIGIGLGTVLLPTISRQLGAGEDAAAQETQNRGMELALLLTLPATMALVLCGEPIAAALFGYGRYTAADTHFTAQALAAFSIGLPSYILVKVLTPGFYARHDTKTPVRYATISMVVNLVGNLVLIVPLQHMGPPLPPRSPRPSMSACSITRCASAGISPLMRNCAAARRAGAGRAGHGTGAVGGAGRADALCPRHLGLAHRRAGRAGHGRHGGLWPCHPRSGAFTREDLALLTRRRRAAPANKS
jgi:putative peptidoglycan lipid II flippase